mmetsp:Transcript_8502/g.27980  ORF Transcript_8502/g.27980 Transcript_8502/m.27980 type:complete len:220 (+) Transcript_8502:3117-3776(+)
MCSRRRGRRSYGHGARRRHWSHGSRRHGHDAGPADWRGPNTGDAGIASWGWGRLEAAGRHDHLLVQPGHGCHLRGEVLRRHSRHRHAIKKLQRPVPAVSNVPAAFSDMPIRHDLQPRSERLERGVDALERLVCPPTAGRECEVAIGTDCDDVGLVKPRKRIAVHSEHLHVLATRAHVAATHLHLTARHAASAGGRCIAYTAIGLHAAVATEAHRLHARA